METKKQDRPNLLFEAHLHQYYHQYLSGALFKQAIAKDDVTLYKQSIEVWACTQTVWWGGITNSVLETGRITRSRVPEFILFGEEELKISLAKRVSPLSICEIIKAMYLNIGKGNQESFIDMVRRHANDLGNFEAFFKTVKHSYLLISNLEYYSKTILKDLKSHSVENYKYLMSKLAKERNTVLKNCQASLLFSISTVSKNIEMCRVMEVNASKVSMYIDPKTDNIIPTHNPE